jgi:hypothetical protein
MPLIERYYEDEDDNVEECRDQQWDKERLFGQQRSQTIAATLSRCDNVASTYLYNQAQAHDDELSAGRKREQQIRAATEKAWKRDS